MYGSGSRFFTEGVIPGSIKCTQKLNAIRKTMPQMMHVIRMENIIIRLKQEKKL